MNSELKPCQLCWPKVKDHGPEEWNRRAGEEDKHETD